MLKNMSAEVPRPRLVPSFITALALPAFCLDSLLIIIVLGRKVWLVLLFGAENVGRNGGAGRHLVK